MIESLTPALNALLQGVVRVAEGLLPFYAHTYLNWIFLTSTFLLALGWYLFRHPGDGPRSLDGFFRFLLPGRIFLHPSAVLDFKFYLVNGMLLRLMRIGDIALALIALLAVSETVRATIELALGRSAPKAAPELDVQVCFTILAFLCVDSARFWSHYLFHRVGLLWEFHRIHHAAEVLTPITNNRIHPIEYLATLLLETLALGCLSGCFAAFYSSNVSGLTIMSFGAIRFFYHLYSNLRHSHIPLGFGRFVSRVFCSPVMHQLHHSADPRHRDKNFSFAISAWDTLIGTLYVPARGERFPIGLTDDDGPGIQTLWSIYVQPIRKVIARTAPIAP
jgi:sterol desaturase/sphingolipid hydroxylase (fatty acid hydroxylase superfamily)